jgi:hypothetical protein
LIVETLFANCLSHNPGTIKDPTMDQERFYRTRIAELALLAQMTHDPALRIGFLAIAEQFHKLADYVANENAPRTRSHLCA